MKVVILAGGLGTRISEESSIKPKPMVEIGGKPIIWHIMKYYASFGLNDFIICCGYKGYVIKEYFANYFLHQSDITFDIQNNNFEVHANAAEPWKVTLVDTGLKTMTGGRLKRISQYIKENDFCMTYGDGVSNIDISKLVNFHLQHKKLATLTATLPPGRFGSLKINDSSTVESFVEKVEGDGSWINGGFFVLNKKCLNYIEDDKTIFESDTLPYLADKQELMAFKHSDFWQPMDTLRDKHFLENLWESDKAPWKVWN